MNANTSILRFVVESRVTGKRRTAYFRAGWTDNNVPLVGSRRRTLAMTMEMANRIKSNLDDRIVVNGGALLSGRSTVILSVDVVTL